MKGIISKDRTVGKAQGKGVEREDDSHHDIRGSLIYVKKGSAKIQDNKKGCKGAYGTPEQEWGKRRNGGSGRMV